MGGGEQLWLNGSEKYYKRRPLHRVQIEQGFSGPGEEGVTGMPSRLQ